VAYDDFFVFISPFQGFSIHFRITIGRCPMVGYVAPSGLGYRALPDVWVCRRVSCVTTGYEDKKSSLKW